MPDEGLMRRPHPASSRFLPIKPMRRVRNVSAIVICVPTVVALVMLLRRISRLRGFGGLSAIYQEREHSHGQNAGDDANYGCCVHRTYPPFCQSGVTCKLPPKSSRLLERL